MDRDDRNYGSTIPAAEPGYGGPSQPIHGGRGANPVDPREERPDSAFEAQQDRERENEARVGNKHDPRVPSNHRQQQEQYSNQLRGGGAQFGGLHGYGYPNIRAILQERVQTMKKAQVEAQDAMTALHIIDQHPEFLMFIEALIRLNLLRY